MAQEHVDVMRRTVEAFNTEGLEAALAHFDPEVEWIAPPEWLEERVYNGREGIGRLATSWGESFDEYRLDVEETRDLGDCALVLLTQRGRIKGSGEPMQWRIGWLWEARDGLTVRVRVFFSWEDTLAAAGLAE